MAQWRRSGVCRSVASKAAVKATPSNFPASVTSHGPARQTGVNTQVSDQLFAWLQLKWVVEPRVKLTLNASCRTASDTGGVTVSMWRARERGESLPPRIDRKS